MHIGKIVGVIHHIELSIKTTCKWHSGRCVLWVNERNSCALAVQADSFKWLAKGKHMSKEQHLMACREVKIAHGMKVRG